MSDRLSNQFPRPPELQPLAAPPARGQQIFSSMLIVAGFILLASGGWMFVQYQYEANKPPPARIVEVTVPEPTETPLPQPSPTNTASPPPSPTSPTVVHKMGDTLVLASTDTPVPPSPTPPPPPEDTPTPESTATPAPAVEPTSESPAAAEVLSLADNPLVVEEPAAAPAAAEVAPVSAQAPLESPITRIVAETIGLDAPVIGVGWITENRDGIPTNIWTVADYAAGWHKNSALPGQGGNIVLSGHHNINGEVFRYTIDMNVGDVITIYMGDQPFKYAVVDKFIVKDKGEPDAIRRENAKWIGPFNEERLTLVTCWPYTNNTHRAIVIAKPVQQ